MSATNPIAELMDKAESVEDATPADGGGDRRPEPPLPPEGGDGTPGDPHLPECAQEPETDIGNGRRLLLRHEDKLVNVANRGVHVFDGKRWSWDETDSLARKLCHDTVERIADERFVLALYPHEERAIAYAEETAGELKELRGMKPAEQTPEQKERQKELGRVETDASDARKDFRARKQSRARHGKSSSTSSKIDNMLREAAPYITKKVEDMDADPLAINCQSGTLRLFETKKGDASIWDVRLEPHRREDLITKLCKADFDLDAPAPTFERFMDEMQPNESIRNFIQRYIGYCLTGLTHEQVFAFFHGGGRNGKSTLVDIVCRILDDYTATVPIETLAGEQRRKGGDATPDLMKVPGARLVRASEPESNMKLREAMIKSLTSDEPILIRGLHKDFTEIYPSFKLIISGNHKPRIDNDDNGIWRRVLLVPWAIKLDKDKVDKQLGRKLWLERNGIFAWMVRGALSYMEEGLNVPPEVLAATEEYRADSNPIGAFLDAFFDFTMETSDRIDPGDIFGLYERTREGQGWPLFQSTTFNKRLPDQATERGAAKIKTNGLSTYIGLKFNDQARAILASPRSPSSSSDHF